VAHYRCGQQITHIFDKQIGVNMKNQPAFPCQYEEHLPTWNGMTLRDYFATKAMQGLIASPRGTPDGSDATDVYYAKCAYLMADAMLKARGE
jgi:hypothetical protein